MFKKKTEVALGGLSKTILEKLVEMSADYSKQIIQDDSSPFSSVDENILMTELLMLSFWNLKTLDYPSEIYDTILKQYLEALEKLHIDKKITFDGRAQHLIVDFLSRVNEFNSKLLETIKKEWKIV